MNKKELQQIIKLGEGFNAEFKKSFSAGIGREICAFANSLGGKILVGVDDKGNISGIKNKNRIKSSIQSISRNMEPAYSVDVETVGDVLVVHVPDGNKKPYSVGGKFFIREGSNSQQLSRDEIREFFFNENLIYWDQKLNIDFHLDKDFSEKRYDTFVRRANIPEGLDASDVLKNLNVLRNEGFCNAGVLIFCEEVTRFFLSATITCVLFQGNTKYKILDRKEFDEDIFSNYRNAMNYLLSHLNTEFIITGGPREEKLELPEEALREALLNAIGHRDYRSTSNIQVYIFNDRVEIINPGGLVSGLKKEDLGKISRPRNPLLFNLMYRMDLVEQIGSGILRINNALAGYGMSPPDIESDNAWYCIVFKRSEPVKDDVKTDGFDKAPDQNATVNATVNATLNATAIQKDIIKQLQDNPNITYNILADLLKKNRATIHRNIQKLKQMNILERIGSDKKGYWKVIIK